MLTIEQDKIVWNADLLGAIDVPKSAVVAMRSNSPAPLVTAASTASLSGCKIVAGKAGTELDCANGVSTQVQLADLRSAPPEHFSTGKLVSALRLDRGPSPSDELHIDADAKWLRPSHRHNLTLSIDYEVEDGESTEDDANIDYQHDWLRDNNWYWLAKTRYYRDKFEAIEQAYLLAGGFGRDFLPTRDLKLSLQTGPAAAYYYNEDTGWQADPGFLLEWSSTWKTPWPIDITHSGQLGWIFKSSESYKFETKTAVSYPVYQGLIFQLSLDADRTGVSKDGTGDDKDDIKWVMGLGYRW